MNLGWVLLVLSLTVNLGSFFPVQGTRSKITLFIKHYYLALDHNDNSTVIGTTDDTSIYNVFHRVSLSSKHLLLVNSITCKCVCIDSCGYVYTTSVPNKDCELTESVTSTYHNCYYKERYDTNNTLTRSYLALNKLGHTKRIETNNNRKLINRESHINVIFGEWNNMYEDVKFGSCRAVDTLQSRDLLVSNNDRLVCGDDSYDNGKLKKNVYTVEEDQQSLSIRLLPQDPVGLRTFSTEMNYMPNRFDTPEQLTTTMMPTRPMTGQKPMKNACISY